MPAFSRWVSIAKTVLADLRYGQILTGSVPSRFGETGANWTSNTTYDELAEIFVGRVRADDVLVDVGCGKGRVINSWLMTFPTHKIYGLELDIDIASAAQKRLKRFPNVKIIAGDATSNLPADGTLFYLFNPFTEKPMATFRDQIKTLFYSEDLKRWMCPIRIFYLNPCHEALFRNDPDFIVEEIKIMSSTHRFLIISSRS